MWFKNIVRNIALKHYLEIPKHMINTIEEDISTLREEINELRTYMLEKEHDKT